MAANRDCRQPPGATQLPRGKRPKLVPLTLPREAAKRIGVPIRTLYYLIERHELIGVRVGKLHRFKRAEVEACAAERRLRRKLKRARERARKAKR